jgi:hypothetical protein
MPSGTESLVELPPIRAVVAPSSFGVLTSTAETATLLVHPRERIRSIVLQRAGTNVASAKLTY